LSNALTTLSDLHCAPTVASRGDNAHGNARRGDRRSHVARRHVPTRHCERNHGGRVAQRGRRRQLSRVALAHAALRFCVAATMAPKPRSSSRPIRAAGRPSPGAGERGRVESGASGALTRIRAETSSRSSTKSTPVSCQVAQQMASVYENWANITVLAVTHLGPSPQKPTIISHRKQIGRDKVVRRFGPSVEKERVEEIARMLAGTKSRSNQGAGATDVGNTALIVL